MKKTILVTAIVLTLINPSYAIWIGCDWNQSTETSSDTAQQIKKQKEEKQLKEQLNDVESSIFKKQHLSLMNPIREKAAFLIAIAGLCGSIIIPFKIIKKDRQHPIKTFGKRAGVMISMLSATSIVAYTIDSFKPILWYYKLRRDTLKKKIFDLKNPNS